MLFFALKKFMEKLEVKTCQSEAKMELTTFLKTKD